MSARRLVIVALVCANVALLATLLFHCMPQKEAQAQEVIGGGTDYLMVTGHVGVNEEAVYIIDVSRQVMHAWLFDTSTKKLVRYRTGRDLLADFGLTR